MRGARDDLGGRSDERKSERERGRQLRRRQHHGGLRARGRGGDGGGYIGCARGDEGLWRARGRGAGLGRKHGERNTRQPARGKGRKARGQRGCEQPRERRLVTRGRNDGLRVGRGAARGRCGA